MVEIVGILQRRYRVVKNHPPLFLVSRTNV